jgi:hypothetical protein
VRYTRCGGLGASSSVMESRPAPVLASPEGSVAEPATEQAPAIATPPDVAVVVASVEPESDSTAEPTASLAEDLPALYRAILDRVAMLEHAGERREAGRIRVDATEAYSVAWNGSARSRLTTLLLRADRILEGPPRTRGWTFRRRLARAR